MKKTIYNPQAGQPIGPYSQAVLAGNNLFVSGQIALDSGTGNLINDTIEEETHQVMKNLGFILEEAKLSFNDVVKCSIFLKDLGNFQQVNEVYGSYFSEGNFPARETVEVSKLPKDVNVEISLIAYKG
ncbi:RidA family protein [Flexithrix dorotheae]|uniref:RidA family protein n=1 Tax=Flexithrix dorotheae TaxID=70993 RepID=UPI000360F3EE|nr:RidA family protein [Flexithrix dorotheae]